MKHSLVATELIKEFEGLSLTRYKCSSNKETIGFGHVILRFKETGSARAEIPAKITKEHAEKILEKDLQLINLGLKKLINIEASGSARAKEDRITQNQYDAIVSLVFNWGLGNFSKSKCLEALQKGDFEQALKEWAEVRKSGGKVSKGLIKRREAEINLFKGNR